MRVSIALDTSGSMFYQNVHSVALSSMYILGKAFQQLDFDLQLVSLDNETQVVKDFG